MRLLSFNRQELTQHALKLIYKYVCKLYEYSSTIFENLYFKKKSADKKITQKGILKYKTNKINLGSIAEHPSKRVNKYLKVRLLERNQLNILISEVFNSDFRRYLTKSTGFYYSIDFFVFYDREHIPVCSRKVKTLEQAYSYKWHFDKPNSRNMLKIILPINITNNHGPLQVCNRKSSKIFSKSNKKKNHKSKVDFIGNTDCLYGFLPTVCWHRDGIPDQNIIATQIMFQLNPWYFWAINSNIYGRNSSLNNKLKIWTPEPKFPLIAYRSDKRIKIK